MNNLAKIFSAELEGIDARLIEVEVDLHAGLHAFNIVGLADKALSEAKERVNSAVKNSGAKPPNRDNRKITVNLAPADVKKTGSHYDLAIAIGYLLATKQLKEFNTADKIFVGELALTGNLRPVSGALSITELAARLGFAAVFLPRINAAEAAAIPGVRIIPVENLSELIGILEGRLPEPAAPKDTGGPESENAQVDFSSVHGQENAKRAMKIAAAGGHNLLMVGPPGAGKSLMAKALAGILPELTLAESVEITKIWSAAGILRGGLVKTRPFRAPHSSASGIAILGGGANPKPGEISLAHRGVLFLDELPEFHRDVLESLRQPLENGEVMVARAKQSLLFPAKFALVAAMNPCPCGYFGDPERVCRCSANEVFRYQKKISGPLLDRIDLQITVPRIDVLELREKKGGGSEGSAKIKEAVARAREIQRARFKKLGQPVYTNAEMSSKDCDQLITLDNESENFLKNALENTFISARGYYRVLKTARTIADLEGSEKVKKPHLAEAFGYRLRAKE